MKILILLSLAIFGLVFGQNNDVEFIDTCKIVSRVPNLPLRNVSALGVAILFNATSNIDFFLNNGCDVNYDGVYREAEETVCENPELFASLGISCRRIVRFEGYTPLNLAAITGNVESVRRLLQVPGVDVNKASTVPSSPISNAVQSGSMEMVRLLVDAGAFLDTREGKDKLTLLMLALNADSLSIVKYLLGKGVDVNAVEDRGYTAVAWAAGKEDPAYIRALADAGADLNRPQSSGQESPLGYAARNNRTQVVKFLLSRRVNVDAVDSQGRTPLFSAAINGKVDIISQLVEAGADVNARESKEDSFPLIFAVFSDNPEAVAYLIRKGADVDAQETNGLSSIYYAASRGNVRILELLVTAGANIDVQGGPLNLSPLMVAAYKGNADVVRFLKNNGADLYLEDKNGNTALDLAELQNNSEVSRILREK